MSLYRAGLASEEEVAQAKTQLNTATAQATDLGVARAQYEYGYSHVGRETGVGVLPAGGGV